MIEASIFGMFGGFLWTLKSVLFGAGSVLGISVAVLVALALVLLLSAGIRMAIVFGVVIGAVVFAAYAGGVTKCKAYADNAVALANANAKIIALEAEKKAAKEVEDFEAQQFPELEADNARLEAQVAELERQLGANGPEAVPDCKNALTKKQLEAIWGIGK